jgi:iron complex transport system substrate-binding protein
MLMMTRLLAILLALLLAAPVAEARTITDSAGRIVEIPDHITRVLAAGPPAAVLLYVLAPQEMIGWVKAPRDAEKPYLLPSVRDLPELGRLTGKSGTANLQRVIAAKPDVIIDFGTISETYKSLADRVQAQTRIPYLLIDGRFANTPAALRFVAGILGVEQRGESLAHAAEQSFAEVDRVVAQVPAQKRPRVYLARQNNGLESGAKGSINTEIIERVGGMNVVQGLRDDGGLVQASLENVITWAPDTIITVDPGFAHNLGATTAWRAVPAVQSSRVFLAPNLPYGFIYSPPSINRLIGLIWLLHTFYPEAASGDLRQQVRDFYHLFYQVDLGDADLDHLLAGDR